MRPTGISSSQLPLEFAKPLNKLKFKFEYLIQTVSTVHSNHNNEVVHREDVNQSNNQPVHDVGSLFYLVIICDGTILTKIT